MKRQLKKVTSVCLGTILAASLTACGGNSAQQEPAVSAPVPNSAQSE